MSHLPKTVAAGALLVIGVASAATVYGEQGPAGDASASRMGTDTRHGGMMGMQGGMRGQMGGMMDGCDSMMQGRNQMPNSQFRKPSQKE